MKQLLEVIALEHNYAQVLYPTTERTKHQTVRYKFGPLEDQLKLKLGFNTPSSSPVLFSKTRKCSSPQPSKLETLLK